MTDEKVENVELPSPEPARKGVITAFLIGGAVLVGLSIFAQTERNKPTASVPRLLMITRDTTISAHDAVIRFVTSADLMLHHDGWMAGTLHPHLRIGDVVAMAGPNDIVHVAGDTFAWKLAAPATGEVQLELFWANMSHAPSGESSRARVVIIP